MLSSSRSIIGAVVVEEGGAASDLSEPLEPLAGALLTPAEHDHLARLLRAAAATGAAGATSSVCGGPRRPPLTSMEAEELVRMARGWDCAASASAAGISVAAMRVRRKRICWKLHAPNPDALLSRLLARALALLRTAGLVRPQPGEVADGGGAQQGDLAL
jgi:hypothetical protein